MTKDSTAPLQMADIARLAGVSTSTVSRALANSSLVSQKTKDLIIKIAQEHNYRPNIAARNFRLKESLTIAVILVGEENSDWRVSDPFFSELLGEIAEAINHRGHQLLVTKTSPQPISWVENFVNRRQADGVILIGQSTQHTAINRLAKMYKGISVWGAPSDDNYAYPVVGTHNQLGGYRITQHLIEQGRKQILFVGYKEVPELAQRYAGFCQALDEAGIQHSQEHVKKWSEAGNSAQLQAALKNTRTMGLDFDGLFAASDMIAITAMHSLQSMGIDVPQEVSVVGYDDIRIASLYNPPITTIRQDRSKGANILVDHLLDALNGHRSEVIALDPELIIRSSA